MFVVWWVFVLGWGRLLNMFVTFTSSVYSWYFSSLSCNASVCVICGLYFCFIYQSVTSCLHPRWIRQSTNSCPTLQPHSIHQREVREGNKDIFTLLEYLQFMVLHTSTPLLFRGKYCTFTPLHLFDSCSY